MPMSAGAPLALPPDTGMNALRDTLCGGLQDNNGLPPDERMITLKHVSSLPADRLKMTQFVPLDGMSVV